MYACFWQESYLIMADREGFSTTERLVSVVHTVVHRSNLESCSFIFKKQDVPVKA